MQLTEGRAAQPESAVSRCDGKGLGEAGGGFRLDPRGGYDYFISICKGNIHTPFTFRTHITLQSKQLWKIRMMMDVRLEGWVGHMQFPCPVHWPALREAPTARKRVPGVHQGRPGLQPVRSPHLPGCSDAQEGEAGAFTAVFFLRGTRISWCFLRGPEETLG